MRGAWWLAALAACGSLAAAEPEKTPEGPRITGLAPLETSPGATVSLHLRGVKLDEATELQFLGPAAGCTATLKEAKKADLPDGWDAKMMGDTQAEFSVTVPAEAAAGTVSFRVVTKSGATSPCELRLVPAATLVAEKEPNGSFREAQTIEPGQTVSGLIKEQKDVDVYRFHGAAGQHLVAEIFAAAGRSLLDSILTLFDSRGALLTSNDDAGHSPDSRLACTLPAEGDYLLVVQDAHDRGSAWHSYELTFHTTP